jgi:hypothetical protein
MEEFDWDMFLDLIVNNQIVPIIGGELILIKKNGHSEPFYSYLTKKIGEKENLDYEGLNFREFVLEYKDKVDWFEEKIRKAYNEIIDEKIIITEHLAKLARITDLSFYISTTYDDIFESILKKEINPNKQTVNTIEYTYPVMALDTETKCAINKNGPTVFKILGSMNKKTCAVTDDEILEYVVSLRNENYIRNLLFENIQDKHLLFLGCDFSDWLLRFFIRILTNEKFVMNGRIVKIIADNYAHKNSKLSFFLTHFKTKIINFSMEENRNPLEFIDRLYEKWITYKNDKIPQKYEGMVFLSYNHEDKHQVKKVYNEMIANGINVFFDEELKSGNKYNPMIHEKIKKCKIFIPFISNNSLKETESYVSKIEWDLAIARIKMNMYDSENKSFVHPIILDDTDVTDKRIPKEFRLLTIQKFDSKYIVEDVKSELILLPNES